MIVLGKRYVRLLIACTGFRPSWGCYDAGDGIVPLVATRDTPGTIDDDATCNTTSSISFCIIVQFLK